TCSPAFPCARRTTTCGCTWAGTIRPRPSPTAASARIDASPAAAGSRPTSSRPTTSRVRCAGSAAPTGLPSAVGIDRATWELQAPPIPPDSVGAPAVPGRYLGTTRVGRPSVLRAEGERVCFAAGGGFDAVELDQGDQEPRERGHRGRDDDQGGEAERV